MPGWAVWGWPGQDNKEQWENFQSNMETFWKQMGEMQKTSIEANKEQWNMFFKQYMEVQESFISSMPDEMPAMPAFFIPAMSPKAFMGKMKEYQEMTNEHAMEQADSFFEYMKENQQKSTEFISEAVKSTKVEDNE